MSLRLLFTHCCIVALRLDPLPPPRQPANPNLHSSRVEHRPHCPHRRRLPDTWAGVRSGGMGLWRARNPQANLTSSKVRYSPIVLDWEVNYTASKAHHFDNYTTAQAESIVAADPAAKVFLYQQGFYSNNYSDPERVAMQDHAHAAAGWWTGEENTNPKIADFCDWGQNCCLQMNASNPDLQAWFVNDVVLAAISHPAVSGLFFDNAMCWGQQAQSTDAERRAMQHGSIAFQKRIGEAVHAAYPGKRTMLSVKRVLFTDNTASPPSPPPASPAGAYLITEEAMAEQWSTMPWGRFYECWPGSVCYVPRGFSAEYCVSSVRNLQYEALAGIPVTASHTTQAMSMVHGNQENGAYRESARGHYTNGWPPLRRPSDDAIHQRPLGCGSWLRSLSADGRSSDDVIAFAGARARCRAKLSTGLGQSSNINLLGFTENLLENTDRVLQPPISVLSGG